MRTRDIKARAEELSEGYEEAREEAFNTEFNDFLTDRGFPENSIYEEDIQNFLDSFDFPEQWDWAYEQVDAELDDIADQKYELEKDRRMGL